MGKGNRNSKQRLENKLAQEEKLLAKEKANRSKKTSDRVIAITCAVIALLIVAILVLNVLNDSGVFIRGKKAFYINGNEDMAVTAPMMTFFVNDYITNWYSENYVYVYYGLMSVNFQKDLKTQKLTANDVNYLKGGSVNQTWYDYFMQTAIESVEMYLTYANEAEKLGDKCKLSDEDIKEINETIDSIMKSLRENDATLADQYGKGITERDIRACYELIYKAQNYSEYLLETTETDIEKDANAIINFRDDNPEDFLFAKYVSYTITVKEKGLPSHLYKSEIADAKYAAEKIAAAKDPTTFAELVKLYESDKTAFVADRYNSSSSTESGDVTESVTESAAETETETQEETTTKKTESTTETETTPEQFMDSITGTIYYDTGDDFGKWIFEESAAVNEVFTEIDETGTELETQTKSLLPVGTSTEAATETSTETSTSASTKPKLEYETETTSKNEVVWDVFKITVYMLTETPHYDDKLTHNIAYMITDNKTAAESFLKAFNSSNEKTRDKFEELALTQYNKLHNVDTSGNHNHEDGETEPVFEYGQQDRAPQNFFEDDYNTLNDWLNDPARADNDYTKELQLVNVSGSNNTVTTYYAVLYFESNAEATWYVNALNGKVSEVIEKKYEEAVKSVVPVDAVLDSIYVIGAGS